MPANKENIKVTWNNCSLTRVLNGRTLCVSIMTILYLKFSGAKTYHEQPQVDSQKASV